MAPSVSTPNSRRVIVDMGSSSIRSGAFYRGLYLPRPLSRRKSLKQFSSLAVRLGAIVVACGVDVAVSDVSGLAQQAQAPGAGAAPAQGQGGAPGAPGAAGQGRRGGGGGGGARGAPLGDGPWEYGNGPNRFRVSVITKGIDYPWGIAFLPDGDLLVTGRGGTNPAMHVIRKGVLDPTPLSGLPPVYKENAGGL